MAEQPKYLPMQVASAGSRPAGVVEPGQERGETAPSCKRDRFGPSAPLSRGLPLALPLLAGALAALAWGYVRPSRPHEASSGHLIGRAFEPAEPQEVDCGMDERTGNKSLVMLTSSALDGPALQVAFRDMVLRLPDAAWKLDGAGKKWRAQQRLGGPAWAEGELYSGLKVLCLEDAAFLQRSFWDPSDKKFKFFAEASMSYSKMGAITTPELVKEATGGFVGLDAGVAADLWSVEHGGIGGFGFDMDAFDHVSIFDMLATDEQRRQVFELQSKGEMTPREIGKADVNGAGAKRFLELLAAADVLAVNGGNSDFLAFVLGVFAPELTAKVKERVLEGSLVYLGVGAGSMVASADIGLTYQPNPSLLAGLLKGKTEGLGLAGSCAVRPNYTALWDIASSVYENAKGDINVVRLPHGEGLCCVGARCKVHGKTSREGSSLFEDGDKADVHLSRVQAVLETAYAGYNPPAVEMHPAPVPENSLDCHMPQGDDKSLVLLTSTALANPSLKKAFREMILRLPDQAWAEGGAEKKAAAKSKAVKTDFHEPALYGGLKVLILEDPTFLKNAFWDERNAHFAEEMGVNYQKVVFSTTVPSLIEEATNGFQGLDAGWGCDYASPDCGGLGGLGFDEDAFIHVSLFDMLASDEHKKAVFALQSQHKVPSEPLPKADASGVAAQHFLKLLESADVLAVNGGNPDFAKYVFTDFAGELMQKVTARVKDGSLIYLGRSAGAMVASSDVGLTYEPDPVLLDHLLSGHTDGLGLAGDCAIRPHWHEDKVWDIVSGVYEQAKHINVIRLPNARGLGCMDAQCKLYGDVAAEGESVFADGDGAGVHLGRIDEALAMAFHGKQA